MRKANLSIFALAAVTIGVSAQTYVNPSTSPFEQSDSYVGRSNGTIQNSPLVQGAQFDRFIQIVLENTDYSTASSSPTFQKLARQGITLTDYHAITHPSQPNYVAMAGGSTQGQRSDDSSFHSAPIVSDDVETIVSLLDQKQVSWASYMENMPSDGYDGLSYTSTNYNVRHLSSRKRPISNTDEPAPLPLQDPGSSDYTYYYRKHNPLVHYGSVAHNPTRLARIRNFNDFAVDVSADALSQWLFITPNMVNNGHDTGTDFTSQWLDYFLVPLLADKRFNNDRTLVLLTFDEADQDPNNHIFVLALGNSIPANLVGTTDGTYYTHYSAISTVESNWGINVGALGTGDADPTMANVFSWVASATGSASSSTPSSGTSPGDGSSSGDPSGNNLGDESGAGSGSGSRLGGWNWGGWK